MKTILFIAVFLLFSIKTMAQLSIMQPELFSLASVTGNDCVAGDNGKMAYNSTLNQFIYCTNIGTTAYTRQYWSTNGSDIYYLGKVGIGFGAPTYNLEINSKIRTQNAIVNGNVGIGTTTPTEKLELKDRSISIFSTADNNSWRIENGDASNRLDFINAQSRLNVNYGGNISIGTVSVVNTHKLYVDGNVSYANSLSVEGKGTLSNTSATQLVMATVSSTATPSSFFVTNNGCETAVIIFPSGTFTTPPAVFLGQNLSSPQLGETLTKTIINVTATTGNIRFCNNTGASINISNQTFSIIAIGQ